MAQLTQTEKFETLEEWARGNQWSQLDKVIKTIDRKSFTPKEMVSLAVLARRAYKLSMALRILRPSVTNLNGELDPLSDADALSEYATCLIMVGARRSAQRVLELLPENKPSHLFAWVTLYFSKSSYEEAIPYLEKYIELSEDEYQKKLGQLNLCACYVGLSRHQQALELLELLKNYFEKNEHTTLLANSYELHGQIEIARKNWKAAKECLEKASTLSGEGNPLYTLFVDKWKLVVSIHQGESRLEDVQRFMLRALRLKNAQSIRDILLHWGYASKDEQLLNKIYFGTPFKNYRLHMSQFADFSQLPDAIHWNGNWFDHESEKLFKIQKQPLEGLKLSKNEIRLLDSLMEDFLEPKSVGSIFESVFPNESLNPEYSFGKTYKLIQRLNRKLKDHGLPIFILNVDSQYLLQVDDGWAIESLNPKTRELDAKKSECLSSAEGRLKIVFDDQPFSRTDVMQEFDLGKSGAVRWLKELKDKGFVEKYGAGPGSFYKVAV